jgi:hypothetical protein
MTNKTALLGTSFLNKQSFCKSNHFAGVVGGLLQGDGLKIGSLAKRFNGVVAACCC